MRLTSFWIRRALLGAAFLFAYGVLPISVGVLAMLRVHTWRAFETFVGAVLILLLSGACGGLAFGVALRRGWSRVPQWVCGAFGVQLGLILEVNGLLAVRPPAPPPIDNSALLYDLITTPLGATFGAVMAVVLGIYFARETARHDGERPPPVPGTQWVRTRWRRSRPST